MNLIPRRRTHRVPVLRGADRRETLAHLRSDMDDWFGQLLSGRAGTFAHDEGEFMPSMEISENDRLITVRAEVPGIDPADIDISVAGNTLTISGEKRQESEERGRDFYHSECAYGSFRRRIELPESADPEQICRSRSP